MIFANMIDQIFGYLCCGGFGVVAVIVMLLYCVGSAVESLFTSDAGQEAAKGVAKEAAKGAITGFLESWFDD